MPAVQLLEILKKAESERAQGVQVNLAIMKKNKKFQKDQLAQDGYTDVKECFVREFAPQGEE